MALETLIYSALKSLVDERVYRDLAPPNVKDLPRITFQIVGGDPTNFVDSATLPSKRNARVQVNCWHVRRDSANALAREVEDTLRATTSLATTVLGGFQSVYEPSTGLFGTIQDFSLWSDA